MPKAKTSPGIFYDSEGNKFLVKRFTHNREGFVNGFYLSGSRGDKEIALSEAKFFRKITSKRK